MGRMFINLIKDIKDKVDIHWCPLQKTFFNMLHEAYIQIYITRKVVKCTIWQTLFLFWLI